MVFYRKYRPQTISELDLAAVRTRLESILKNKDLPHAFLFTGPKGLGKTSTARILAKAINCEKRNGIEPCNKCDACVSITNGSNLDVLEIDAASNRGIDEIRDLRDKIKFAPSSLKQKIYIIDEVHMLTADAFNALLKTLEEPPSHAAFILCTTEEEKIPPTIASRTFRVKFNKPTRDEIKRSAARITDGEKLSIEENVFDSIFKLSEGSFRDAAKIIEELAIASNGKKITNETLGEIYSTGSIEAKSRDLLDALSKKDAGRSLGIIEELASQGADFKTVTEKTAEILHSLMLKKSGMEVEEEDIPALAAADLKILLEMINQSYKNIKFSVFPQLPLELVVVEWCLDGKNQNEKKTVIREDEVVKSAQIEPKKEIKISPPGNEETAKTEAGSNGDLFRENSLPENFFLSFLTVLKRDNHSIAGILRGCRLVELSQDSVLFETAYKFHKDKLNEAKISAVLDKRASELLRRNVRVRVDMKAK